MRYFQNTSWMMGEQFLRIIAGLFVGVWVARYLGPEEFGLFSYVLAFTSLFGGIAKLGLDSIMVRELVSHPENRDTYLSTAFWLKVIGAIIVMGLIAAIVPFTSNDTTTNLFIFIIASGLVFQSFEVVEFYFQAQVLAKIVSICKVTQLALSSVIKIYLVLNEAELIYFVLVTAFDAFSLACSYFIAYKIRKNTALFKHFDWIIAKELLKNSWPLVFIAIFTTLYARIDQVMIKVLLGEYEVGLYSAAIRLTEAWLFVPVIISASLFPAILAAKKISKTLYEDRLIKLYTLLVLVGLAVCLFTTGFSELIIRILFGEAFSEGSNVLSIRIWETFFAAIGVASGKWIVAENLQRLTVKIIVAGALINIGLNYILIPIFSIEGAALASLISIILTVIVLPYLIIELRGDVTMRVKAIFLIGLYKLVYKK
jgi:O-antigen/teichoic acid export membrane protein